MLGKLAPGDMVTVTRIDRLARSTFDLFGIVKRIVDARAQFRSLAEPWADSTSSTGRLMLGVLGGLADVERDLTRTRIAEGRSRAKTQGKHMGRLRRRRKRPPGGARRALRSKNWRTATTSVARRYHDSPVMGLMRPPLTLCTRLCISCCRRTVFGGAVRWVFSGENHDGFGI